MIKTKRKKNDIIYKKNNYDSNNGKLKTKHFLKKIKIKLVDNPIQDSIDHYNNEIYNDGTITIDHNKDFLLRITLNFIRHRLSNYEQLIHNHYPSSFRKEKIKESCNELIIKKYKCLEVLL